MYILNNIKGIKTVFHTNKILRYPPSHMVYTKGRCVQVLLKSFSPLLFETTDLVCQMDSVKFILNVPITSIGQLLFLKWHTALLHTA